MKQTAVDFISEKYNYVTWLRNRDEISAGKADEFIKIYLDEAKKMEKEQIIDAYLSGKWDVNFRSIDSNQFYQETYIKL
jgi:hypothetical protein